MRIASCFAVGALVLLAQGCHKHKPSPEFEEASGSYSNLVARLGDDAYADAEMDRIEGLLAKVSAESSDAKAAADLTVTIASERKRIAAEAAAHQKALDDALKVPELPSSPTSPTEEITAIPDAGPSHQIKLGMSSAEVAKASEECFAFAQNMRVRNTDGVEVDGIVWELRAICRSTYPDYENRMLVFEGDKLVQVVDKGILRHEVLDAGAPIQPVPPPTPDKPVSLGIPAPAPVPPPEPPQSDNQQRAPPPPEPSPTTPGEETGPGPSNANP